MFLFFFLKYITMRFFSRNKNKEDYSLHVLFDWADSLVCAAVLCILFFTFCLKTMRVVGSSMYPTYVEGQRVMAVNPIVGISRGDVVVTDEHNGTGDPLIKRVIAVSGDTLFVDNEGKILINGEEYNDYVDQTYYTTYGDTEYPIVVPDGMVFLMGDNREVSYDSRYVKVGCISLDNIVGKVFS